MVSVGWGGLIWIACPHLGVTSSDNSIWAGLLSCLVPACRNRRSIRAVRGLCGDGVSNVDFPGLGVTSSDNSI